MFMQVIRACIHAYVLAHCGTYIHVFKRAYVHRESSRIHTRARTYGHLCSHTYIHMHMHTHVHACAHMSKCTDVTSGKEIDVFLNTMKSETAVWGHSPASKESDSLLNPIQHQNGRLKTAKGSLPLLDDIDSRRGVSYSKAT